MQKSDSSKIPTAKSLAFAFGQDDFCKRSNHQFALTAGAFSADGQTLALGSSDGAVRLWRVSNGSLIRTIQGRAGEVGSVLFSPDNQTLVVGWSGGELELRRVSDGDSIHTLSGHTRIVRTLSLSRDGRLLASGGEDRTIRLWQRGE